MASAEFPLPSVNAANPAPLVWYQLPDEFVVSRTIYDDNGADYKVQAGGAGKKTWVLEYDGLTAAQAAILDSHLASAFYSPEDGSANGFNYRDRDGTLYSNVHYAPGGFERRPHKKIWIQARGVKLEKRP